MNATDVAPAPGVTLPIDLKLGTAANLLYGVGPVWSGTADALFAPPLGASVELDTAIEVDEVEWGFPILTLHEGAQSLLSTLFDYRVAAAFQDTGAFAVGAGPLALGDADAASAAAQAGKYLGVELSAQGRYMLVRLRRSVGAALHPAIEHFGEKNRDEYLTESARATYAGLPNPAGAPEDDLVRRLSDPEAALYLQAMYQLGTHFVASVQAGDVIFQAFAYPSDRFAELQTAFERDQDADGQVTGIDALNFQYYTTPVGVGENAGFGYASARGALAALSGDPQLAASLAAGEWDDARYAGGPSVFQAYAPANVTHFLDRFQAVAPIGVGLAPLCDLVTEIPQAQALNTLLKGALLQKHGAAVTVSFAPPPTPAWQTLLADAQSSWLSTIATPTIDVYQELVELGAVELINTEVVESFTVVSMVLLVSGSTPLELPGEQLTIVSYVLDATGGPRVPTLQLTPAAFAAAKLSIGEMYGALTLAAADGSAHDVLLEGLRFTTGALDPSSARSKVALAANVRSAPDPATLEAIATDLQFSMVAAESLMLGRSQQQDAVRKLAVAYLEWLASLVPEGCQNEELVAVAAQAQYLAKAALGLDGDGAQVPYLTFESYEAFLASIVSLADDLSDTVRDYQQKIEAAKQAELTAKTAAEINANVKATGELLTDYFGVLASNQQDMADYYGSIADQKRQEFSKAVTNVTQLQASLKEQQKAVDQEVSSFQDAVANWETEQILKLCFQVASDVFTGAVAIMVPATEISAVKSLGETAQKIQKVMTVLTALSKLEGDLESGIKALAGVQRALDQLEQPLALPSSLEWQEFSINMNASLAEVPGDLAGPKARLVAAFAILALRGQALVSAQAKQAQLLTDIYFNERQGDLDKKQVDRLNALRQSLHLGETSNPELPKVDLVGLTGEVQARLKQVLAVLAKTLVLQDATVQYTYLGEPTSISSFDLTTLKQVMMRQQANIIHALEQMNPPPLPVDDPIEYRVAAVPTGALSDGAVFSIPIQPSASEFLKYAMVRTDQVLLRIDGVTGSDSGEYLANLAFVGEPFEDRDASGRALEFNTVVRHFGPYAYDIASGAPRFGDQTGKIAEHITKVTPFGNWQVALPPTSTNRNITFAGPTVDVVLTFKLTALRVDSQSRAPVHGTAMVAGPGPRAAAGADAKPRADVEGGFTGGAGAAVATGTSVGELLNNMYGSQAVLKGWDVVFNVLEAPVNALLQKQFSEKYAAQEMPVEFGFCQGPYLVEGKWIGTFNKFHIVLSGPLLTFQQNNHSFVTVKQNIKSATLQQGTKVVTADWKAQDASIDEPGISWEAPTTIDVSNAPYVEGSVPLGVVQGLVRPSQPGYTTQSVVLEFPKGSFVAINLKVTTDDAELNLSLSNWFVSNPITYIVNTVDFSAISKLAALTPTRFMLNVLTTNSGKNVLQQFITTNGTQRSNLTINVNEPIPDGYECSLMINTQIMFEAIFVQSFNQGSTNIIVEARKPPTELEAWSAQIKSGTASGTINLPDDAQVRYRIDANGNGIVWEINGLQFLRSPQATIKLEYVAVKVQRFEVSFWEEGGSPETNIYARWGPWEGHSVNVNVVMTGGYPIAIQNSGQYAGKNQTIQLVSTAPEVNVSNTSIKPTGPCECNDHELQKAVLKELEKDVPGALQQQMANVAFSPISVFALESLLFPGGQLITMDAAYVPGDLLVLGHFTVPPTS